MAEGKALLAADETAEGAEAGAVPDLRKRRVEDAAHVEGQTRIQPASGIDEGVVLHRGTRQAIVTATLCASLALGPREFRVGSLLDCC
jgi:hypothetical protein